METQTGTRVEIGIYDLDTAKKIRDAIEGETYMDFDVILGVNPGNERNVTVYARGEEDEEKVRNMIIMKLAHSL